MKIKPAWSLAELVLALVIIAVISISMIASFKPQNNQTRIFVYSTIRNLTKGNIALIDKYADIINDSDATWYCKNLLDMFSLTGSANCANNSSPNATFANGVQVKGLHGAWVDPTSGDFRAMYKYKEIVIDIDGFSNGLNKIGADQIPMRIYKSDSFKGGVLPSDCSGSKLYDLNDKYVTPAKNTYCGSSTFNFLKDNSIVSYDIYKGTKETLDAEEAVQAMIVHSGLSPMEADCKAYGGKGLYTQKECNLAGFRLSPKCAMFKTCIDCDASGKNTCPVIGSYTAQTEAQCSTIQTVHNPQNTPCFTIIHKPSIGAGFLIDSILSDVFVY